jgi:hypothetical protein
MGDDIQRISVSGSGPLPESPRSALPYAGAIAIVLLVVGSGYYFLAIHGGLQPVNTQNPTTAQQGGHGTTTALQTTTATQNSSSAEQNSTVPFTVIKSNYISKTQAQELLGPGGAYQSGELAQIFLEELGGRYGLIGGNNMSYIISSPNHSALNEYALAARNATNLYPLLLRAYVMSNSIFTLNYSHLNASGVDRNITVRFNETSNGMTYSYSSFLTQQPNATRPSQIVLLIGTKNNQIAMVNLDTNSTPVSTIELASSVSSQLT